MAQAATQKGTSLPEDKGSSAKSHDIITPDPRFVPQPSKPILQTNKSIVAGHADSQKQYYTPPHKLRVQLHKNLSNQGMFQGDPWSTQGQHNSGNFEDRDDDEMECNFTMKQLEEHLDPQLMEHLNNHDHFEQHKRHFQKPPAKQPENYEPFHGHYQQSYDTQLSFQHKAVARGPKLNFPEFNGEDPDGWIRKAEKYFEMVAENRVPTAVIYITSRAEYWWRGTACNSSQIPWHHFCRMVDDRFNTISQCDRVGQFHNLKQVGSVSDYVDMFEEIVSVI